MALTILSTAFCISQKALGCINVISRGFKKSFFASAVVMPLTSNNLSIKFARSVLPFPPRTTHSFVQDMSFFPIFQ